MDAVSAQGLRLLKNLGLASDARCLNSYLGWQQEMSPVFGTANYSADHNVFFMETMNEVAAKHGLAVLFHEKPFAGINGNGKHANWSVGTDTGINFFYPGKTKEARAIYTAALACLSHGIYQYNELLRCAVTHAG